MITLRCTKKLQQHLGIKPEPEEIEPTSTLGDWYGNLVFMPKAWPLILITNERTLLSVVLRHDADVLTEFKQRVIALLRRLEIPNAVVEREALHLQQIRIGKTRDRRVLGSMNDAAVQIEVRLFDNPRGPLNLEQAEDALAENLYSMLDYTPPTDVVRELLGAPPRSKPPVPLVTEPEDGPALKGRSRPEDGSRPDFASALDLLSLVLNGPPPKKRTKIAEGQTVPVKLSARDRDLIIEHAMIDPDITAPLEKVPPEAGVLNFGFTLDDLDELLGYIAVEANHCKSKKLQRELQGLYDRLKDVMESYDDGGWQS
jgi:hypothetical protein